MHASRTSSCAAIAAVAVLATVAFAHDAPPAPQPATPAVESAAAPSSPAVIPGVETFGAPVTVRKALPIAKLEKKPSKYAGKTVRVEGVVGDVCQGAGCWIKVTDAKGVTFLAKSLDESVLVPKDCKGAKVVVQGVVTQLPAKGHDHEHSELEEGHSCPAPSYVVATQGVELRRP